MDQSAHLIRRAAAEDSDVVLSLAQALATTFELRLHSFRETFIRLTSNHDARILVAESEQGIIDRYLLGFTHDALFANGAVGWIEEMYVSELVRRSGVGSALEGAFEEWAQSRGAILISLATRRAAPFCLALDFEESASYFRKLH
jgi:GNAT superfamily N-acetyltransferase